MSYELVWGEATFDNHKVVVLNQFVHAALTVDGPMLPAPGSDL